MAERQLIWLALAIGLVALLLPSAGLSAKPAPAVPNAAGTGAKAEIQDITTVLNKGRLPVVAGDATPALPPTDGVRGAEVHGDPVIGELRNWLGLDFVGGFFYRKQYQLRGLGQHIEVWVAEGEQGDPLSNDLDFLPGDCRNGVRTQITDEQVAYLVQQFDTNIYPKESAAFSVPPPRDGSGSPLPRPRYHPEGDPDNIVVLIDNVRDENFYDFNNTNQFSYVAGFFSGQLNELFDRNIMTIDGWDWLHRTGPNPPHEPVPGDPCNSAPARPFLYEGVFAHEYQHLLENYEDPDEENWVNEGLSDWAQTLTGYVDPAKPITEIGFDSHIQCFLGWLGVQTPANPNPRDGGPENSLTLWGDQGEDEILCDYGAAYTMMEFLHDRYGTAFMSALHREDANGLVGLQAVLTATGRVPPALMVLHDWAVMVALDAVLDDGARLRGDQREGRYQTDTLHASINWDTPEAYSEPGAPPNGSDYVRARNAAGAYLNAQQIRSITFDGANTLAPLPVEWTVDPNPPGHPGDPALYSGTGNNFDRAIVRQVTVPTTTPTLTFESQWNTETGWDFGVVQISIDGGATYRSISCTDTTSEHDPGAIARIVAELPGFTGYSEGWRDENCDLTPYAGQTVLLSFRYLTDPSVEGAVPDIPPGWWIDDVAVGGTLIEDGAALDDWQTPTQINPIEVTGYKVQVVGYTTSGRKEAILGRMNLHRGFVGELEGGALRRFLGNRADVVGIIVTYDDPTETVTQYACYTLRVNGVTQPGGCGTPDDGGGGDDDDDDDRAR